VGTGRSATWTELAGFTARPDITKKSWDEFVRCLPRMWTSETYAHQGEFWSMPERAILPRVYQRPHPPLWVAVTSPGTELDAADRGLGSLGLVFGQFADQERRIAEYRRRIQLCEPVGEFVNDQVSTVNFLYCHEDDATGRATGRRMADTFNYLAAQLISAREAYPTRSYPSLGLLPQLRRAATGPDASEQAGEGLALGGPERVLRALKRWEAVGVDRVNFLLNAMEVIPQAEVLASLRLFAREVMPAFAESKPANGAAAGGAA
jgi:alkanesulfonate monooxygenase SsuD/methylene tetrahydromethanopterin reductase-like flavin-dependent oxidoreductase (luciferase family)